jgi:hypothetical protein
MMKAKSGELIAPPPPRSAKIPLTGKDFSVQAPDRQLTVSYRLLPPNRRKAAPIAILLA